MEMVTGPEYTVDVYVDLKGIARCAVPRRRLEVRAGEVSKGLTVRDAAIIDASMAVAAALPGAVGCITLQCFKRPNGEVTFIEINARFGGGYPLELACRRQLSQMATAGNARRPAGLPR